MCFRTWYAMREQVGTSAYMIDRDNQWILVINDKGPGVCNESPEKAQGSVCPLYR